MHIKDIEKRYNALGVPPAVPGDREWTDRITTFADFMKRGPDVVRSLRNFDAEDRAHLRSIAPGHWDLLHEVFSEIGVER
jgi:hypothetical protein